MAFRFAISAFRYISDFVLRASDFFQYTRCMTEPIVEPESATPTYTDEDLVYVDPKLRIVVGRVEFLPNGKSKPLEMKEEVVEAPVIGTDEDPKDKGRGGRPRRVRYYPWGTYRSMKKIYKIEGKQMKEENHQTLDEVIEKAIKEPFWD